MTAPLQGSLDLLELFLAEEGPASFTALRARSGLPHASFSRAIKALCQRGYLAKTARGYVLGPMLARLASRALRGRAVQDLCRPVLLRMMQESGERAEVFVRRGAGFVLLEFRDSVHELTIRNNVGVWMESRLVAAPDIVLVAHLPEMEREAAIGAESARAGVAAGVLRERLARAAGDRVCAVVLPNGVFRVAAPVFDADGSCIAALALAAPAARLGEDDRRRLEDIVRRGAVDASSSGEDAWGARA